MPDKGSIRIVCGLGNPGEQYALTRHNAGFCTVDVLAERYGARYWKSQAGCLTTTVRVDGENSYTVKILKIEKGQDDESLPISAF